MEKTLKPELWEAILSNDIEKVRDSLQEILATDEDVMTSLARNFEVIMFKNVPVCLEIVYLISSKLMEHRFFFTKTEQCTEQTELTIDNLLTRINIIKEHTNHLTNNQCEIEYDAMFSLRAQIICHHMEVLKKFLKKTYYFLPWEEMQFCLLMFAITLYKRRDETCIMYKLVLDRKRVITHLQLFTETLWEVGTKLGKKDMNSKVRLPSRKTLIKSVVDRTPGFDGLYSDYEIVRDIYSLTKITYYIQESLKPDHREHLQLKKLTIQRALQVIGENLKNSAESPNISPYVHRILMKSAPSGLRDVVTSLRDVMSHSHSLLGRMHVEDNKNTLFLTFQSDLQLIQSDIYVALNEVKFQAVLAFLQKIRLSSSLDELKYLLAHFVLGDVKHHNSPHNDVPMIMVNSIQTMCNKIYENIPDKTNFELTLFDKIFELLGLEREKIQKSEYRLRSLLNYLSHLMHHINFPNDLTSIKETFDSIDKAIKFFRADPCNYYKRIRHLLYNIYTSLRRRNSISELELEDIDRIMCILHVQVLTMTTAEEFKMDIDADHIYEVDAERHVDKMIETISSLTMPEQWQGKIKDGWRKKKLIAKVKSQCNMVIMEMTQSKCYANSEACDVEWQNLVKQLGTKKETEEELVCLQKNKDIEGCKRLLNLIDDSYATLFKNFKDYSLFMNKNKQNALKSFLLSLKLHRNEVEHIMTMFDKHLVRKVKVIYKDRLRTLKNVLGKEDIVNRFINDDSLQLAVETLVLDLLQILETLSFCGNNRFFVDDYAVSITGKALRNFLAHGNLFLEILRSNTEMSVICTAFKLLECGESLLDMKHVLIGKMTVPDDKFIKRRYLEFLHQVDLQISMLSYVAKNDCDNVKKSIEKGASVFGTCTYGYNILQHAAQANALECFKFGLEQLWKAKVVDHSSQLSLSLYLAAKNGSDKIIDHYIENHLDLTCSANGVSLVHILAQYGHTEILRTLIAKHSFDVRVHNDHKASPLHLASKENHLDTVNLLLSHGCCITDKCLCAKSPLHVAAKKGHTAIVDLLLNHDALPENFINEGKCFPLHLAAENGYADVVSLLLRHNANPLLLNTKGMTALQISVSNRHLSVVKLLFCVTLRNERGNSDVDPYTIEETKKKILTLTCLNGNAPMLKFLLDEGMSVDEVCTENGSNLVQLAIQADHRDVVNVLIAGGAGVDWRNFSGQTPLHFACEHGRADMVTDLLTAGARLDALTRNGLTPLSMACLYGHADVVETLLDNGADINLTTFHCTTPLHAAVWSKDVRIVNHLLDSGADVNAKTFRGVAPLHLAARTGKRDVARALLSRPDALVDVEDDERLTPLHIACRDGHAAIVRMLLDRGARIDAATVEGEPERDATQLYETVLGQDSWCQSGCAISASGVTPVHLAALYGHLHVVALLADRGAPFDVPADNGMTPLVFACQEGRIRVAGLLKRMGARFDAAQFGRHLVYYLGKDNRRGALTLLKLGVSANAADADGVSALHQAVWSRNADAVRLLLARGAAANRQASDGRTPLHWAVQPKNDEVVRVLLRAGADPHVRCSNGETPVDVAVRLRAERLIEMLREAGGEVNRLHGSASNENCHTEQSTVEDRAQPILNVVSQGDVTSRKKSTETNTYKCCQECSFASVTCINCGGVFHRSCAKENNTLLILDDARVVCCSGEDDGKVKSLYARIDALITEKNMWKKRFEDCHWKNKTLRWNNKMLLNSLERVNVVTNRTVLENPVNKKLLDTVRDSSHSAPS